MVDLDMVDLAFLTLRATTGGLLAGHGAQKLFGLFEGPGFHGTSGWLESMGLRPGRAWALAAGLAEFGGGVLTLLGAADPLGPLGIVGAMSMATFKVHAGKPIWVTAGGAELPVTNMAIAGALMLAGPGKYSVDEALGLRVPRWIALPGLAAVAATVAAASFLKPEAAPAPQQAQGRLAQGAGAETSATKDVAGAELQAGGEARHPL